MTKIYYPDREKYPNGMECETTDKGKSVVICARWGAEAVEVIFVDRDGVSQNTDAGRQWVAEGESEYDLLPHPDLDAFIAQVEADNKPKPEFPLTMEQYYAVESAVNRNLSWTRWDRFRAAVESCGFRVRGEG